MLRFFCVMSVPWIIKYKPKSSIDIVGQEEQLVELKQKISSYKKGDKPIFLYGGTGNGKTSSVYAVAEELDLEVVEVNASDIRKAQALESVLGNAIGQMSLFGSSKVILVDEAEGLSGVYDRGAAPTILKLQEKSQFPVVIVASDAYERKLKEIRKKSYLIEFKPVTYDKVYSLLKKISLEEQISAEDDALKHLARVCGGDVRAAVNDLQNLGKTITLKSALSISPRDRKSELNNALRIIYKTKNPDIALRALDDVNADLDEIFLWIEENTQLEYLKVVDLDRAFENIALADKFFGRIRRWQYYRFYVYCYALLTAGVSLAKADKYSHSVDYKQNSRPLKIWIANRANAKKDSIASKLAQNTHVSRRKAKTILPYIKYQFKHGKSNNLIKVLELNNEEIDWLKK